MSRSLRSLGALAVSAAIPAAAAPAVATADTDGALADRVAESLVQIKTDTTGVVLVD